MAQEVPYITIKSKTHQKASNISNLVGQQRNLGFPVLKKPHVEEYITIPFPDFCTIYYEITIWAQFESQMNEILEKIFYNYDFQDSFVMWSEFDNATKKGNGYRFVGYRDGNVTPQNNIEQLSDQERVVKHTYNIKVPTYLILDPKDEALAYGRNKSTKRTDDNSKYVYKNQNAVSVQLKEELVSSEIVESLKKVELDLFSAQQDADKQDLFNLLSKVNGGGGGGGGSSPTFDSATPQPIALVGSPGSSGRLNNSDHVHAHGNLAGGTLHDAVSLLSAGFAPTLTGSDGFALVKTGASASWREVSAVQTSVNGFSGTVNLVAGPNIVIASGSGNIIISGTVTQTQVTGSDNFFVNQILTVSGSVVNPTGHLILSSGLGYVVVSGSLQVLDSSSIMTRGKVYNDSGDLVLSSSSAFVTTSGTIKSVILGATGSATLNGVDLTLMSGLGNAVSVKNNKVYFGGALVGEFKGIGASLFGTSLAATTTGASSSLLLLPTGDVNLYFDPTNSSSRTLKFSGSRYDNNGIYSPNGHLILSGASGSFVTVSGNLNVIGDISSNNLDNRYVLTSSLTSSVINVGDNRYTLSSSFTDFSQSVNTFTASQISLNAALNGFTASFTSSVQVIADLRYVLTGSTNTQRVNSLATSGTLIALGDGSNPSIIVSGSRTTVPLVISGSSSGSISAVDSHLILSSSAGSIISISGALRNLGAATVIGLLTVNPGGSGAAASFTGGTSATAVTVTGGNVGGVAAGSFTGGSGNPNSADGLYAIGGGANDFRNGGVGISATGGSSSTGTPGNGITSVGGTNNSKGGIGVQGTGGAGNTNTSGSGGAGIKGIGGNAVGSGSAGVGVIGQGGTPSSLSGSRISGIGLSGSGVVSGSGGWFVGGDKGGHAVVAYAGLSTDNGVGNAYVISGTFASASIVATDTNLILSSSAGSMIFISGGLALRGPGTQTGRTVLDSAQLQFTSSAAALFTKIGVSAPYFGAYNIGAVDAQNNTALSMRCGNTAFLNYSGGVWEWFTDLSTDNISSAKVKLSASTKGNVTFIAQQGHLIFSSSMSGSVIAVSGNLRSTGYASASLPAPNTVQSGTITYVNDLGFLAIAWNGEWSRISTSSF